MIYVERLAQAMVAEFGVSLSDDCGSNRQEPAAVYLYTRRRFPPIIVDRRPGDERPEDAEDLYEVCIIDNDYNTYEEVMQVTMLALGINEDQAFAIAWEVDHQGCCVVAHAPKEDAEAIASMIRTIGIEVQVSPVNVMVC